MKLILILAGLLLGTAVSTADAATTQYSGINLEQGNALQMQLCTLNPGKSMANYERVFNDYIEWSKENEVEVFVMRAVPTMLGASQDGPQFDFIDMLIGPFENTGSGWTKWLTDEDGQKLNSQWQDVASCRVSINAAFIVHLDQAALSATDERMMVFNWCSRKEDVSTDQLIAKHQQLAAGMTDASPIKAWTIMYPGLGSRGTPGEFAHLLSFADANGLMAWQNALANEEGWRLRQDYETSYADCIGDNVYHARVLNRPGS